MPLQALSHASHDDECRPLQNGLCSLAVLPPPPRLLLLLLLLPDYSQVELRLLAHFSGDRLLQQLLSQSGPGGDVFSLIAAAWLQQGRPGPAGWLQLIMKHHLLVQCL
jgi:hypothetical protein